MLKLFTIQDANGLIPVVDDSLSQMKEQVKDIIILRQELDDLSPFSIEAHNKVQEISFLLQDLNEQQFDLFKLGVFIEDAEVGKVVFPSQVGAEVVYLAHELGQSKITHYKRLNEATQYSLNS
ncbi:MAG TPA: DUF2203 family protein [Trueperaceae bacterium]|nr:DUF2203 family protein [Trueperaceae bacterium]